MAKDPYKYFRIEARELLEGLTQGVLALQERPSDGDALTRMLRLAHTLKGASRVVKLTSIGSAAHAMEDLLAPHRASAEPVPSTTTRDLFRLIDVVTTEVNAVSNTPGHSPDPPPPPAPAPAASAASPTAPAVPVPVPVRVPVPVPAPDSPAAPAAPAPPAPSPLQIADTVRVDIADVDAILSSLSQAAAQVASLRQAARAGTADLNAAVDRVERELGQVRDRASQLRLLPAQTIFAPLARAAADAAQSLGKRVELTSSGGEARLEAHVLSRVRAALLHVVRNAVAHGIEAPEERRAAGKPAAGRVELRAVRRGSEVTFVCGDDGRGIDWEAVRRRVVERGLSPPAQAAALDQRELARLLLGGGVSTAREVDEVSGRGVGLSVVDEVLTELRGTLAIDSVPGSGTRFALTIPISLSALTAIALQTGDHKVWLPLEAVKHVARLTAGDIVRSGQGTALLHRGEAVPFATLHHLLRLPGTPEPATFSAAIVEADGKQAAVAADRLSEVASVVVRPVPAVAGAPPLVGGAALDIEGNPLLVLSAAGLVDAVTAAQGMRVEAPTKAPRRPILVIDDSLTTRMLEQSILEAAGYDVDTAVSAEEGLEKANHRRYGLFLVDVEMPGMSGFEFVAHTRAEPAFRDIPAILVTSLASPEHRRRGAEVGAYAYMVKGEYDEGRLRQLIRSVIG